MARKVRRTRKPRSGRRPSNEPQDQSPPVEPKNRTDAIEQFELEYAYVLKDLRQILILALAMFILLILLNILLQLV